MIMCIISGMSSITASALEIDNAEVNQTNISENITSVRTYRYRSHPSGSSGNSNPWILLIAIGALAVFYVLKYQYLKSKNDNAGERMLQEKINKSQQEDTDTYGEPQNFTEQIAGEIRKKDGNFSGDKFIWLVENYFIAYMDAYSDRNIKLLEELTTEDIFFDDKKILEEQIENNTAHIRERINFETDYLFRYEYNDKFEYVTLYIKAKMVDYMQNVTTEDSFHGSKTTSVFGLYLMTLRRKIGDKTVISDRVTSCPCPKCGSNVDGVIVGKCKFCGQSSKIINSTWRISAIAKTNLGPELGRAGIFRIS